MERTLEEKYDVLYTDKAGNWKSDRRVSERHAEVLRDRYNTNGYNIVAVVRSRGTVPL